MPLVRGRTVDEQGNPVPGATVVVTRAPVSVPDIAVRSDERGEFVLTLPAPGRYQLGGRAEPAQTGEVEVDVPAAGDVHAELRLAR